MDTHMPIYWSLVRSLPNLPKDQGCSQVPSWAGQIASTLGILQNNLRGKNIQRILWATKTKNHKLSTFIIRICILGKTLIKYIHPTHFTLSILHEEYKRKIDTIIVRPILWSSFSWFKPVYKKKLKRDTV